MEEADLIKAGQRGDVGAFNSLVVVYQDLVYNVSFRMLGDPDSAADLTQDVFLSAFKSLKGFRGGSFKAWLLRIATNACYDRFRRQKRRPETSLDEALDKQEPSAEPTASTFDPEEYALRRELIEHLQRGLSSLPLDQRIVVILSDVNGLAYDEIAQATGANLGTVKSRLSRGRAQMRDFLLRHGELLPRSRRHNEVR